MRTEVEIPSPPKLNSHDNNNQKPKQGTKAHPPNLTVNPAHVCVGSILWLLPDSMAQEEEREILCNRRDPHSVGNGNNCNSTKIRPEGWDHPVLVLDIKQRSDSTTLGDIVCTVVPIQTWSNTDLLTYQQRQTNLIKFFYTIPIYFDSSPVSRMYAANGGCFAKLIAGWMYRQSYICYQHTYDIPLNLMRAFSSVSAPNPWDVRLNKASYEDIMQRLSLQPEPYLHPQELVTTSDIRLANYAIVKPTLSEPHSSEASDQEIREVDMAIQPKLEHDIGRKEETSGKEEAGNCIQQ